MMSFFKLFSCVRRGKKSRVDAASGDFVSDVLQRKLKELEEENLSLRSEVRPPPTPPV